MGYQLPRGFSQWPEKHKAISVPQKHFIHALVFGHTEAEFKDAIFASSYIKVSDFSDIALSCAKTIAGNTSVAHFYLSPAYPPSRAGGN